MKKLIALGMLVLAILAAVTPASVVSETDAVINVCSDLEPKAYPYS